MTQTLAVSGPTTTGAVTVGGRAVWVVYGESTLARIDPTLPRVTGRGLAGAIPAAVVFADRAVWVVNSAGQTVSRFDPGTFDQGPVSSVSVGRKPSAIAFGDDALWVADSQDDAVTRIDPGTGSTFTIGDVGHEPVAIAWGADAVWVASRDGTVARIDPVRRKVIKTIHVGSGIAVGGPVDEGQIEAWLGRRSLGEERRRCEPSNVDVEADLPQVALHDLGRRELLGDVEGPQQSLAASRVSAGERPRLAHVRVRQRVDVCIGKPRQARRQVLVRGAAT